jgi:hypothetical protein
MDCPEGLMKVEVLDKDGEVIKPFDLMNCESSSSDKSGASYGHVVSVGPRLTGPADTVGKNAS